MKGYWILAGLIALIGAFALLDENFPIGAATLDIANAQVVSEDRTGSIGTPTYVPYSLNIKRTATTDRAFEFIAGDKYLAFTPTRIAWDGKGEILSNNSLRKTTDSTELNSKETRTVETVKFDDVFGTGIHVGATAYKDKFSKLVKIDSLASLGTIPVGSTYLEIEFKIDTNYTIPNGPFDHQNIYLDEGVTLLDPNAWDANGAIPIEGEIVERAGVQYLIKRIPVKWLETATYPVYTDADTIVSSSIQSHAGKTGLWGPYWISTTNAALVFIDTFNDLGIATTTDGGATWNTTVTSTNGVSNVAVMFDQEVPGDTGTLMHIGYFDDDDATGDARYVTYDINSDTMGTIRTVEADIGIGTPGQNRIGLTKTVGGNIIYVWSTQSVIGAEKSSDNFATAGTTISDVFETGTQEDWVLCAPAATADDNDAACLFLDRNVNTLSIKMYDDSANSWTETNVDTTVVDAAAFLHMDLAVRHSDSAILTCYHDNIQTASHDLHCAEILPTSIASPTVTAKTSIFTARSETGMGGMMINQQNDDVYFAFQKGGTWGTSVDTVYHKSTDDMGTWGTEQAYSEQTSDDLRMIGGGRTVGNSGGYWQPVFENDDLLNIYVNLTNDVAIAAAGGGGATPVIPTIITF